MFVTSLRYKEEVEGGTQIILQNRKTKETESAQREGMSNARRFSEEKAGQRESERESEREGKVSE